MSSNKSTQPVYCGLLEPAQGPLEVILCARASQASVARCSVEVSLRTVANYYSETSRLCRECESQRLCLSNVSRVRDIRKPSEPSVPELFPL